MTSQQPDPKDGPRAELLAEMKVALETVQPISVYDDLLLRAYHMLRVVPPEGGPRPGITEEEWDAATEELFEALGEGYEITRDHAKGLAFRALTAARHPAMRAVATSLAAQIPNQRAVEAAYRKASEVSQASLNYEVRASGAGTRQEEPPIRESVPLREMSEEARRREMYG